MDKIYVTKPSIASYEEYIEEITNIWDTMHITNFGPEYHKFIDLLKERYGYEYLDLQCNGHMMLQNILSLIPKGEIITTPFTFASTTLAIVNSGHKPVFCDIKTEDYNIDVDKIEELITDKTVAIVPVHVYGSPCDVDRIQEIADKYNLKVIYDAAHALNVKINDKQIGEFGDASMFSFHATKVFNSIEGGMGVFKNEDMMEQVKLRSNFGLIDGITVCEAVNSKMNEFSAAMGIVNLNHLDENILKRKHIVELYDSELSEIDGIQLLNRREDVEYNYAYYPILLTDPKFSAKELLDYLAENNIFARRYFYPAINDMPLFKSEYNTPVAKEVAENILCIPLYADLTKEQAIRIAERIKDYAEM